MYDTILVPTDGSESADRAVDHGLFLAEQSGATMLAMYVVDTSRYGEPALSSSELVIQDLEERGDALVDDVAERAAEAGIEAETIVCHGRPDEAIVAHAADVDADLLVMGYQGHSHEMEGHMGSVVNRVIRSTDRPVLTRSAVGGGVDRHAETLTSHRQRSGRGEPSMQPEVRPLVSVPMRSKSNRTRAIFCDASRCSTTATASSSNRSRPNPTR